MLIHALRRFANFIESNKIKIKMKTFIENKQINKLHRELFTWMKHLHLTNYSSKTKHLLQLNEIYKNSNIYDNNDQCLQVVKEILPTSEAANRGKKNCRNLPISVPPYLFLKVFFTKHINDIHHSEEVCTLLCLMGTKSMLHPSQTQI